MFLPLFIAFLVQSLLLGLVVLALLAAAALTAAGATLVWMGKKKR